MSRSTRSTTSPARHPPIHYQHDPVHTTKTSVMGAINALGFGQAVKSALFCKRPPARYMAIPNEYCKMRATEASSTSRGRARAMTKGKRCAETLFYDYHRQHNLKIRIARIFNTYGLKMHPNDGRWIFEFHHTSAEERTDHDLWRRLANKIVLFCRRSRRWAGAAQ